MGNDNNKTSVYELLGEARAIHLAMRYNQISYEQAKERVSPILKEINKRLQAKTKEFGRRPKRLTFYDLGRMI